MRFVGDLSDSGPVKSVGWLAPGRSYPKGKASQPFFSRLVALVEKPLVHSGGFHRCSLGWCCLTAFSASSPTFKYHGRNVIFMGSSVIFVPGDDAVYSVPSLILHYIRWHKYLPPECFRAAVLNCPDPGSSEYVAAVQRIAPELAIRLFGREK